MNNRLDSVKTFGRAHPVWMVVAVAAVVAVGAGMGRATGVTDGHPVLMGRMATPVAIYVNHHGQTVVWQDADGQVHGHLQERSWWIQRFLFGSVSGEADTVRMSATQVADTLAAEAKAISANADKAAKLAAKRK